MSSSSASTARVVLFPVPFRPRIVMLAPPNRGSQLAAGMTGNPVFRWFYGPAGARHVRLALTALDERIASAVNRLD